MRVEMAEHKRQNKRIQHESQKFWRGEMLSDYKQYTLDYKDLLKEASRHLGDGDCLLAEARARSAAGTAINAKRLINNMRSSPEHRRPLYFLKDGLVSTFTMKIPSELRLRKAKRLKESTIKQINIVIKT